MDVKELLEKYAIGERDFQKIDLQEADLRGAKIQLGNRTITLPKGENAPEPK